MHSSCVTTANQPVDPLMAHGHERRHLHGQAPLARTQINELVISRNYKRRPGAGQQQDKPR